MPTVLLSFKKTASGRVMFHGFTAPGDAGAEKDLEGHAAICPQFGPAHRNGETIDRVIEVDELPEFDEESIDDWIDEMFGLESDEEDEEELEDEEEEEETEK
jgi:hypothetical protein